MSRESVIIRHGGEKIAGWAMSDYPHEGEQVKIDGVFYTVERVYYDGDWDEHVSVPNVVCEVAVS